MVYVCCKTAYSFDTELTNSQPVEGLISVAVNPSTSISQSIGTISLRAYSFDKNTTAYLRLACGSISIESAINWLTKRKCGEWTGGGSVTIPGTDNSIVFIPQIQSPVTVAVPYEITSSDLLPPGVSGISLEGFDMLNQNNDPVNTVQADGSSGPQANTVTLNTYFFRYIRFDALHPIFDFNTYNGTLDNPVSITIENETYEAYPQSFNLTVAPPSPAIVSITYVFEDTGVKPLEITNCDD